MWQRLLAIAKTNVFPIVCYLLAAYFGYGFAAIVGIPPSKVLDSTSATYLALAVFLVLAPEAKKLKLGQLIEFESKVAEVRKDVKEFKDETRAAISTYATLVSAISNTMSQTINVNLPGREAASEARAELETALTKRTSDSNLQDQVESFVADAGGDWNYALAKLRMLLERELRRIVAGRPEPVSAISDTSTRFLSTRSLFNHFVRVMPGYERIAKSFDYVLRVCNAAIHGQIVSEGQAKEALWMGLEMLTELRGVDPE
jgi:hypothetical protein